MLYIAYTENSKDHDATTSYKPWMKPQQPDSSYLDHQTEQLLDRHLLLQFFLMSLLPL